MAIMHASIALIQLLLLLVRQNPKWFKNCKTVLESIGILLCVALYQGLILRLYRFFIYDITVYKNISEIDGTFKRLDSKEMLILIDILLFISIMGALFLELLGGLLSEDKGMIFAIMRRYDQEYKEKDFWDSGLELKLMHIYFLQMTIFEVIACLLTLIDSDQEVMII